MVIVDIVFFGVGNVGLRFIFMILGVGIWKFVFVIKKLMIVRCKIIDFIIDVCILFFEWFSY